ncbi:afadin- and alpha-actinin-binding protein-like [Sceloporus undulatus]|uniref:afadin- and alpha-actinin-binding protein-like n=1 Tax=Sceloporus undulatus TaxID=8520 RepID=UPI001C4BE8DB|nr:afadin- and alpha-actinin-binding protein-like [Sceloporus undulatus]XP_042311665.1 afadin- and alpha-actinin-binding protein-like [Sceloporus undulatus]
MEPLSVPATPGGETFTADAQCIIGNYACELGLSPAFGCNPTNLTDSVELLGELGDLGDVICWSDNVDHCISYLSKELETLGFPALYKDDGSGDSVEHGFDLMALVNGTTQLLSLYQGVTAKMADMEAEEMRRAGELDYLRTRHGKLKDQVEGCEKEIAAIKNKEQQLQSKNKQLNSLLKEEKDEITKLLSALANQKQQHLHEMKKKEQELLRLKEKMSQLVTDKKDKRGTIDILNTLPRVDGKRATWKTGKSLGRKEEELYRTQLVKQERREQALALENAKLKQLLREVGQDMEQVLGKGVDVTQGMEQSCPYQTFQEQWCSLRNSLKSLGCQAVTAAGSQLSEEEGQDPVISVTDHDKEIMKLKGEIEESRVQIAQLQQCFQEQLAAATTLEMPEHLKGSYFLEEEQQLLEERAMFEEQKRAFEKERGNFTEAAIRLGWERKQFEEQKAQFMKEEFFCSLPRLDKRDPNRRFSAPVAVRAGQEHEDSVKQRRWAKPICTPYPKIIITPCRSSEFFRRRPLISNPTTPAMCRQPKLLLQDWPASPMQLSQSKESRQDTACQTETPMKEDFPVDLLDRFLNSCL